MLRYVIERDADCFEQVFLDTGVDLRSVCRREARAPPPARAPATRRPVQVLRSAGRFHSIVILLSLSSFRRRLERTVAGVWVLGLLALLPGGALAQLEATPEDSEVERVVFLLQYIAVDYGVGVRDGAIVNPFEYAEMSSFSQLLVDRSDELRERGASEEILGGIRELRAKIAATRPWSEVQALASDLAEHLVTQLGLIALPTAVPDLDRGRRSYEQVCASCHGATGEGDGPAASGMDPPPTSFSDARMNLVSPHQLYGAIQLGIQGTAMPSFRSELDASTVWDIAFFLMTLRKEFAPHAPELELPLTLSDLARRSNQALLARVRAEGVEVDPPHIDHYRGSPGSLRRTARPPEELAKAKPQSSVRRPVPAQGPDLQVALRLQDAFADVAQQVVPSVVGVVGLIRQADGDAPASGSGGSWRGGVGERLYPGFRAARSGSGFLVSDDGYILTTHDLLTDDARELVDAVDVELHDGRHELARIVGTEPTIKLGILKLEQLPGRTLPELRAARIGESASVRVGHWAIALGNPAGPGTSFAVGTLSSGPERQCYQEELTATLMQTSLGIPAGGYGGPLTNIEGEVVGVMVPAPGAELPELVHTTRSLEFALPIDLAMAIYEPLKLRESRKSPWLGFSVLELGAARPRLPEASPGGEPTATGSVRRRRLRSSLRSQFPRLGVYIDDVFEPSPAAAAGVRIGDILLSIDGNILVSVGEFQRWLYLSGIGRTIELEIFRDGQTLEKRVTVEERPKAARPR
jgi:S1-C subfamily serine protease/mono/diheme cytochrome c family protein